MIACDASLLFGAVEERGRRFEQAELAFATMRLPFCTTEACLTEALYLAGARIGWKAQKRLWLLLHAFEIEMARLSIALAERLMHRYRDVPMDFADATLVALASEDPRVRIATFDRDFVAYRRDDGTPVPLIDDRLLGWIDER